MFIHGSVLIYIACKCTLYLTNRKKTKAVIPILTLCSITIAYLYTLNIANYLRDFTSYLIMYSWLFIECIPVYYFIAAFIRSKLGRTVK